MGDLGRRIPVAVAATLLLVGQPACGKKTPTPMPAPAVTPRATPTATPTPNQNATPIATPTPTMNQAPPFDFVIA